MHIGNTELFLKIRICFQGVKFYFSKLEIYILKLHPWPKMKDCSFLCMFQDSKTFLRKMFLSFVAPLFITGNLCIAFAQDIQVLADKELPLVGIFTY
jgi:hypothetical protein